MVRFFVMLPLHLILMALLATQPVAMDLYLPTLPQIANDFGTPARQAQWTLTAFVLAFGLAQLFVGSVADHYGRRHTLLYGLVLYVFAAVAGIMANHLSWLIATRVLQGVATAACVVSARAAIRDVYSSTASVGVVAKSMMGSSLIGLLSPILGGVVGQMFGWHGAIVVIAVFGMTVWLMVYFSFAETFSRVKTSDRLSYRIFFRHPQFVFSSLLSGVSFSGAVCFLLLSPFIFIEEFGLSQIVYGLMPALCSLAFLLGTGCCHWCLKRMSVPEAVRFGTWLSVIGGSSQCLLWFWYAHTPWILLVPQCVFMLGHGFHQPCGQGGAVSPFPQQAGRAAALSGLLITTVAFIVAHLVLRVEGTASNSLVYVMLLISGSLALLGWVAIPYAYGHVTASGE